MRKVLLGVGTFLLVATVGLGAFWGYRGHSDAKRLALMMADDPAPAEAAADPQVRALMELPRQLDHGALAFALVAVAAAGLIGASWSRRAVVPVAAVLIVAAVAAVIVNPSFDMGALGPAAARSRAIVLAIAAALGAACAYGGSRARRRDAASAEPNRELRAA